MREFIVFCFATFSCFLSASESHGIKLQAPGISVERIDRYSTSKKDFDTAVKGKEKAIQEKGGAAMVNEAHQPTREITLRTEKGFSLSGVGGASVSSERTVTQSAAEQALKNSE